MIRRTAMTLSRFAGTVKTWNHERGFGFIEPDKRQFMKPVKEMFVPRVCLTNKGFFLDEEQRVTFEQHKHTRNRAINVSGDGFVIPVERKGKVLSADDETVTIEMEDGRLAKAKTAGDWESTRAPKVGETVLFALQGRDRAIRAILDPRVERTISNRKTGNERSKSVSFRMRNAEVLSLGDRFGFVEGFHPINKDKITVYFNLSLWRDTVEPLRVGARVDCEVEDDGSERGPRAYSMTSTRSLQSSHDDLVEW